MKLSLRNRILSTYAVLVVLFIAVVATGLWRLQEIGSRLSLLQSGYLPIVKTVNSFFTLYHLDERFDVSRIVNNRNSRPFMDSITIHNPAMLETGLQESLTNVEGALKTFPSQYRSLRRIGNLIEDVLKQHSTYVATIRKVQEAIKSGNSDLAMSYNNDLLRQKRLVRSRIEFLSRRVDDRIRGMIHSMSTEERNAVWATLILSFITLGLAVLIGTFALFSLRPLEQLKSAAKEIAAGDLKKRVELRNDDEVGAVGREFNRMADAIEERDRALRRQQDQLLQSEKMAVVGRMASKISHEIRNPLNALSLNVEMLGDEVSEESPKKIVRALSTEIERLSRISESYLSLARPLRGDLEEIELPVILRHLESLIVAECNQKGMMFKLEMGEPLPRVKAEPARLEQALLNLVRNAMDAAGRGGELGLRATMRNQSAQLEVWDSGPGIAPHVRDRIFEPFFTTKEKGTGLGLAITSEIVRDQDGTLECRSAPGQGTSFILTLPAA